MTRAKAKIKLYDILEDGVIIFDKKGLIDTIYDDFESRTCINCEFFKREKRHENIDDGFCFNPESHVWESSKTFGCNEFEKRKIRNEN